MKIEKYVNENKKYIENPTIKFIDGDYRNNYNINVVDLTISQYAGFVGQYTKKYLKKGGILLCNDSHGDATLAKYDSDFELVGVVDKNGNISEDNLEEYFKSKKNINLHEVEKKMKGPKYLIEGENYIFKKII